MAVPGGFAGEGSEPAAGTAEVSRTAKIGLGKRKFALGKRKFDRKIRDSDHRSARILSGAAFAVAGAACVFAAGCGNMYRPVINPVRPTGPSPAPTAYAVAITQPTGANGGVATVLDFSGDTVLAQASVGSFPLDFTLDSSGSTAYTIDRDGSLSVVPISTSLQTKNVGTSTLTANAIPINTIVGTGVIYVVDQATDEIDVLTGTPPGLKQAIPLPESGLINLVGRAASTRFYAITQNAGAGGCATPGNVTANGAVSALEAATNTISTTIQVGICPVYGVGSADGLRAFILNRGGAIDPATNVRTPGTVSVIDVQKNILDAQVNSTTGIANGTFTLPGGPVYAELYDAGSKLVIANYDSNTISVIDVTTDAFDNDAPTFGNIHNVTVGSGPSSVTVLQDGTRAYVANSNDGTISVVSLSSYTVQKTITLPLNTDGTTPHPRTVASSYNYPTGKIYVTSPDSQNLVILRTDTDTVDATLELQGNLIDVRATRQNANTSTQIDNTSYSPGNGVPCTPGTVPVTTQSSCSILLKTACFLESGQASTLCPSQTTGDRSFSRASSR